MENSLDMMRSVMRVALLPVLLAAAGLYGQASMAGSNASGGTSGASVAGSTSTPAPSTNSIISRWLTPPNGQRSINVPFVQLQGILLDGQLKPGTILTLVGEQSGYTITVNVDGSATIVIANPSLIFDVPSQSPGYTCTVCDDGTGLPGYIKR